MRFGNHQVGCGGNGDRIAKHNAVRDVIYAAYKSVALASSKETPGSFSHAGVLVFRCARHQPTAGALNRGDSSNTWPCSPSWSADNNLSACQIDFIPLVAEAFGGLAEDTIHTITKISRAIEDVYGLSDSACLAVA